MGAPTYEQQVQQTLPPEITVVVPEGDTTLLWIAGVIVPLIIGIGGWYFNYKRKKDE